MIGLIYYFMDNTGDILKESPSVHQAEDEYVGTCLVDIF